MRILIKNGTLIDPANRVQAQLNILTADGKIAAVTAGEPEADLVIDAAGKVVCPGFIDIHMHEDPVIDGHLYRDEEKAIFPAMLRMGVTTVVAGNCGDNVCDPADYLDLVDAEGAAVNVAMLCGHTYVRKAAGHRDKYSHVTDEELQEMVRIAERSVKAGCAGVSFGIRYVPGTEEKELLALAALCRQDGKMIASHIRSDAAEVFDSLREFLDIAVKAGVSAEVSHIGSMSGFGQMEEFLKLVGEYKLNGLDVSCDCYPYYAFSTGIGETTYDPGWLERYNCDYDVVEMCEGKYKGQRCTKEIFEEMRRDDPGALTVCYVMKEEDVDRALADPNVMLGSDGVLSSGQGHPRAAGAFARLFSFFVRGGKISLYDAVAKTSAMAKEKLGLRGKGSLGVGDDADIVIFDPLKITDRSTFTDPTVPPVGIDYVILGGEIAAKDCKVVRGDLGKAVRIR